MKTLLPASINTHYGGQMAHHWHMELGKPLQNNGLGPLKFTLIT
jgi:hypothetical protein